MAIDSDHWLEYADIQETPNIGGKIRPEMVVIHFTGGNRARNAIRWLRNPRAKVSAHLVIDEKGLVTQLAPFNRRCHHAGKSRFGRRKAVNGFSIGIELSNPGLLAQHRQNVYLRGRKGSFGPKVDLTHVTFDEKGRPWHRYSELQLEALWRVLGEIRDHYGIHTVAGHEDVCIPHGRKIDPGPVFPMACAEAVMEHETKIAPVAPTQPKLTDWISELWGRLRYAWANAPERNLDKPE